MGYYQHNKKEYEYYINKYPPTHRQLIRTIDLLLRKMKGLRFTSCFELGMGYGYMVDKILKRFRPKVYVGIDLSEDQIREAKKYLKWYVSRKRITVKLGDIIKYKDKRRYDLVFCSTVLSHIPEQYVKKAVNNMCRLSKKHIIIVEPTIDVIASLRNSDDQWLYNYKGVFEECGWKIMDIEQVAGHNLQYMRFGKEEQ